ncbi:hypothetical protein BU24DRAFT_395948 [Aaosphaeria arxii CBS 175.79]|uniref:Putative phospholipase n=1 Tax=Aaosphaeria arxii CBS 175.79 TaxID=1450172 RepID=A0A6A5XJ56_9PLEO|nr:uncharacterized protein BU24DRAFT_395948 [Aaosphaeria arxii CBS 175.79]KAF2012790.1 hypothetical protein BU24DRAFT_395948 [Aaosphaeria arxii CBS 175.79]
MMFPMRRFTWRRFLLFGSAFVFFWIFVFSLTPLTAPLPPYTGQFEVGILDLEVEVEKRVINEAILKETGEKAFELSTLAVTLYYPTNKPLDPNKPEPWARPWLPQPISLIGTGYARLAGIRFPPFQWVFTFLLWALGSRTVIPGVVDAPLLSRPEKPLIDVSDSYSNEAGRLANFDDDREEEHIELRDEAKGSLPCVVFTHGMAGMSQSYSHYLGSIASHGAVVAAVEHRDGSGPGSIVHYPDGREKKVWHMTHNDFEPSSNMTPRALQIAQLAFREAEMHETVLLLQHLNSPTTPLHNLKPSSPESSSLPTFQSRLNLTSTTVIGHSYGATGALQALKPPNPFIAGGIALDPGKSSGPLNHDITSPNLILHSGEWTEKQTAFYDQGPHFGVVRDLAREVGKVAPAWFMTLRGTAHPSVTDAPLIVPWVMRLVTGTREDARTALAEYVDVSVAFLRRVGQGRWEGGGGEDVLGEEAGSPEGPLGKGEDRGTVRGRRGGVWEVHVAPSSEGSG